MGDTLSAEDFIRKLRDGALRAPLACSGFAKSMETGSDAFLFSPAPSRTDWAKIPATMVESVEFLGNESSSGASHAAVRVRFKEPSERESEAAVFASLFRASAGAGANLGVSPDQAMAAAVVACFPPIGTMIAAVLAAVAAVIAMIAALEAKSRGEGKGAEGTGPDVGSREKDLVNALRHLLSELARERNGG